jgi:hypothetical protein
MRSCSSEFRTLNVVTDGILCVSGTQCSLWPTTKDHHFLLSPSVGSLVIWSTAHLTSDYQIHLLAKHASFCKSICVFMCRVSGRHILQPTASRVCETHLLPEEQASEWSVDFMELPYNPRLLTQGQQTATIYWSGLSGSPKWWC